MDEGNFEAKKSSKGKIALIVVLLIVLVAAAATATWFVINKANSKPEKVFGKAIEEMFEGAEKESKYTTSKIDLDISGQVKTTGNVNSEMKTQVNVINAVLQSITLNVQTSVDTENKIADYVVSAKYMGENVVSLEGLIQDNKLYFYLKDLYSKYIEISEDDMEGVDLANIFETATLDPQLAKDIKALIKEKIENSEMDAEEAEIEVKGKDKKVNKSTLTLSFKELMEISEDILEKVKEHTTNKEVKEMITEILEEAESATSTTDIKMDTVIELYTEKTSNKIVGFDIKLINKEIDELMLYSGRMTEKDTWEIEFKVNEESTDVSGAETLIKIIIKEENENEGQVSLVMNISEENLEVTLNVAYKVEYDVDVEKKNVRNSIKANQLTEADAEEIMENIQKNEMLNSIVAPFIEGFVEGFNEGYNGGNNYYDDNYNDDYNYDYNSIYNDVYNDNYDF